MKSRFSAYLMVAMVVLFFCSCDGKKDKTLRELKDVSGCQVKFPDVPLFRGTKSKILVLVADTGECSPCSMGVNEWYVYRLDMEERHLDADIVFVLPEGDVYKRQSMRSAPSPVTCRTGVARLVSPACSPFFVHRLPPELMSR